MIINETIKKKKTNTILNEENYSVYKRRADQDLFLYACSLTPRNSFYHSEVERLNYLVDLIQKNDSKFIEALTYYLGKILGIRLSPAIIIAELALRDDVNWKAIEKIVRDVFTRPDFIANTLGYIKYKFQTKSFLDRTPYEFSKILKSQLESFNELTLKRRKMKRKAIKLADLIKTLRPRPKDEKMSRLYKAIIENDNYASLKTEIIAENKKIKSSEHITAAISSSEVSYAEKKKFVQDNIEKIPINALIKNLSFLETKDIGILEKRLVDIFESGNGLRFINPFDLIMLNNIDFQRYSNGVEDRVDSDIIHVLDKILSKYVHINVYAQNPLILYDCSGSMDGNPHRIGIKFISAFQKIFRKDFRFYKFDYDVENITNDVKRIFIDSSGANEFARKLMRSMPAMRWMTRSSLISSIPS